MPTPLPLTLILVAFFLVQARQSPGPDAVLLQDVQVLTLYSDKQTTGRRTTPMPQLQCVGGSAKAQAHTVTVVQCENKGHDGQDFQWRCEAQLDAGLRLGRVSVSCEGYRDASDEWVLVGSCGLEYELERDAPVPPPPRRHTTQTTRTTQTTQTTQQHVKVKGATADDAILLASGLVMLFVVVVFIAVIATCCQKMADRRASDVAGYRQWTAGSHRTAPTTPPIHTVPQPVVVTQPPIVVQQSTQSTQSSQSRSDFVDGLVMGSLMYNRPPQHTTWAHCAESVVPVKSVVETVTTTTVVEDDWNSSSWYSPSSQSSAKEPSKSTSVGYGGTKRR